ncbi:MAG: hypothetical protein LUD68_09835 [Rikenellaceae bacterium]|nr:hypothetical protein [Rikenellaceae bacterium]
MRLLLVHPDRASRVFSYAIKNIHDVVIKFGVGWRQVPPVEMQNYAFFRNCADFPRLFLVLFSAGMDKIRNIIFSSSFKMRNFAQLVNE